MELSDIRAEIDAVDRQLLQCFLKRMQLSEAVADYKNAHHLPIYNEQREREILENVCCEAGDMHRYAYQLYLAIFELSRQRQAELLELSSPCEAEAARDQA